VDGWGNGVTRQLCKRPKGDDPLAMLPPPPPPPPPPPCVVSFDERMLLHEEQADAERPNKPVHPERPDRLRAILARLHSTGIFPVRGTSSLDSTRLFPRHYGQRVCSLRHTPAREEVHWRT
jgi:hypothetical protein